MHRGGGGSDPAQGIIGQHCPGKAIGVFLGDKGRGDGACDEFLMVHHGGQERQIMPDPLDLERIQSGAHFGNRQCAGGCPGA